ncbi:hypothetical protein [Undibacterium umbellatum]|uniref:Uncharacterized protein n=1 Tax=Undibacterium umbellatum TaxID=2762300 RepID=A0ABR6Z4I3_9BURK|nr:hypothetical protein [Undibacterium umbellatum]MBC3906226.1 hypothetical protein [Undibacterium umbellatum]
MSQIVLAKKSDQELTETQRQVLRDCLYGMVDGQAEEDQKAWRNFWRMVWNLGSGEFFSIETLIPRLGPVHRKQMKLEGEIFKNQERFKDREMFRLWLKVGSGWVIWCSGPKGGVFPVPRSISYKKCDEGEFQIYCAGTHEFFRTPHAQKYLWPHVSAAVSELSMEAILANYNV